MTTVTVKTSELVGAALDWAVAQALGVEAKITAYRVWLVGIDVGKQCFQPSTDWNQCGPLIESAPIDLEWNGIDGKAIWWTAKHDDGSGIGEQGSTPLIAACRAIVAAKLGDTVEVPEVLL